MKITASQSIFKQESVFESPIKFIENLKELEDLDTKVENNEIPENSILMLENINFFKEEQRKSKDRKDALKRLENKIFVSKLLTGPVFVNDSVNSIWKKTPTNCDIKADINCIGLRIEDQLNKLITFFSIKNGNKTLIVGEEEDFEHQLKVILTSLLNFKRIVLLGRIGMLFLKVVCPEIEFACLPSYWTQFVDAVKFILVKCEMNGIHVVLPSDLKLLPEEEFNKYLENPDYGDVIKEYKKRLIKAENYGENAMSDVDELSPEELEKDEEYAELKLNEEETAILELYKADSLPLKVEGRLEEFVKRQKFEKPKKILKNDWETFNYEKKIFDESTVKSEVKEEEQYNPVPEGFAVVDYGEETYQKLCDVLESTNNLMWLGRLSPSKMENTYNNYEAIVKQLNARKSKLKAEFNELTADDDKKPLETELRGRKHLFNVFLKNQEVYDIVRVTYKKIFDEKNGVTEEEENADEEDDQFGFEMASFIDFHLNDAYALIERVMRGEEIHGFNNITLQEEKEEEEELDMRFLEEI